MPAEDSLLREAVEHRSRKGREFGTIPGQHPSVFRLGSQGQDLRENTLFEEQTGFRILGEMTLSPEGTLGTDPPPIEEPTDEP